MPDSDTTRFVRLLALAERATADEDWPRAADLWAEVVAINPVRAEYVERATEATWRAERFAAAIPLAELAMRLGAGHPTEYAYRVATCHARLGDLAAARAWLERAMRMGFRDLDRARTDDNLAALRTDPAFRRLFAIPDGEWSDRAEGWRFDLELFAREIKRRAPKPWGQISESAFDTAIADLIAAVPHRTDAQIYTDMLRTIAVLSDGHARVRPPHERADLQTALPLQFAWFQEGCFVIAADTRYEALLGGRIERIGESPIADLRAALVPLIARDNEQWLETILPFRLRQTHLLHALGLIADPDTADITVRTMTGETLTLTVASDPAQPSWNLPDVAPYPASWAWLPETLNPPLPLYLRNPDRDYWFTWLADEATLYLQFNHVRNAPGEDLAAFTTRVMTAVDTLPLERFVLDLRHNGGGNTLILGSLLHALIGNRRINQRGRLFVIIGRQTFSAAQNFTNYLDQHTEAIFVGEPTGSSPIFIGESLDFELPYSHFSVNISDLTWVSTWPGDFRSWIGPHLYTPPTFAHYRENRDPAMEAILSWTEHLPLPRTRWD
jgi:hypothetical protein